MTRKMNTDGQTQAANVSSIGITVPDATHGRFRKLMCRCTEEKHSSFPYKNIHEHFSKNSHESVDLCSNCEGDVYGYYFNMDKQEQQKYCTFCSHQKANNTSQQTSPRKDCISSAQPISQSHEDCDAESSGIGTECCSTVSSSNGQSDDGQSTSNLHWNSSLSMSDTTSMQDDIKNGSLSNKSCRTS